MGGVDFAVGHADIVFEVIQGVDQTQLELVQIQEIVPLNAGQTPPLPIA